MRDDERNADDQKPDEVSPDKDTSGSSSGFSRRDFLKVSGITLSVPLLVDTRTIRIAGQDVKVYGPGKVPITLNINKKSYNAEVEPRMSLLDTLRADLELTGSKRVCDRGTCGACTVLVNGKAVYSCSILAIEAQGKAITTVEGLMDGDKLHPVQQAFVDNDAQQCGYCTPGFVVACKAFLDRNPHPTVEDMKSGLGGNVCRCGTYEGIKSAVMQVWQRTQEGGRADG
ncbi:MAG TPA: (2Fe-2S)-binding protein [Pyrinomonadaceae bacterium]|nr:(2Fe-2S)-binding protein [Pyrinomonadaceae bacterium]